MNKNITYIKELSLNYTIETTPKVYEKISNLKDFLTPKTCIYITYLPDQDPKDIINVAKKIKDENF